MPLQPLLTVRQRWVFRGIVLAWGGAQLQFWLWWFQPEHWVSLPGMFMITAVMALGILYQIGVFMMGRAKVVDSAIDPPGGRVAMVVTKAPAEPWPLVQRTLEAALDQDYPEPWDVWLADEAPTREVREWCAIHGVGVSTREGAAEYHRSTWPRRTRCKEGNLAYFYDHIGYVHYDFVCQFDADHAPARTYLTEVMRCFADPGIGYVAAPSQNTRGMERAWAARGRVFKESPFHGPYQAGGNGGLAPQCIGSHYAVRTAALQEVGGIGPELAEDYSTTVMLTAHGWRGAFALQADCEGDAAPTFADAMTQEMQWARSLITFLWGEGRKLLGTMLLRERLKLTWAGSFYAVFALAVTVGLALPVVALLLDVPWVKVAVADFLVRASLPPLIILLMLSWARRQGWLRPTGVQVASWETVFYDYARWPWAAIGVGQAIKDLVRGKPSRPFKLTPKGGHRHGTPPARAILPYILLAWGGLAVIAGLYSGADQARGYLLLTWVNAAFPAATALVAVWHYRVENPGLPLGAYKGQLAIAVLTAAAVGLIPLVLAVRLVRSGAALPTGALWTPGFFTSPAFGAFALAAALLAAVRVSQRLRGDPVRGRQPAG